MKRNMQLFVIAFMTAFVKCTVLECSCEIFFEGEALQFHYRGLQEFLLMGAEMFVMQERFPRENYREISVALANSSSCTVVLGGDLDYDGNIITLNKPRKTISRAVIIEPRPHPALKVSLENICEKLHLPITLFHGTLNTDIAQALLGTISCVTTTINIGLDNLDSERYNELLLSDDRFWAMLDVPDSESILIFQTDSGICGEGSTIQEFEQYDYCGGLFLSYHTFHGGSLVGNGGFSIRNVGAARRLLRENPDHRHQFYWEDVLFSHWCLKDPDCNVCSEQTSAQFASTGAAQDSPSAWAFHRNWKTDISSTGSLCDLNEKIRLLNTQ